MATLLLVKAHLAAEPNGSAGASEPVVELLDQGSVGLMGLVGQASRSLCANPSGGNRKRYDVVC
jgi:hypothetical protein